MENKSQTEQQLPNQKRYTQENTSPSYKKILKTLARGKGKTLEYMVDQLAKFRLTNVEQIAADVAELTKQGVIIVTKTNKGFIYKLKEYKKNEKEKKP